MVGLLLTSTILLSSLLLAWLRGGRLKGTIPGYVYPLLAVAVQLPISQLFPGTLVGKLANIAGYLLLVPFLWINRRSTGLMLVAVGVLLNFTVISANGGRMPADNVRIAALGVRVPEGELAKHQPLGPDTRLPFLADVIRAWPLPELISFGDIFIAAGTFLFIQEMMGLTLRRWRHAPA